MSMEQITKESRRKVHEANQAKAESDLRLKNTEHDVMKRVEVIKNAETEVIAKLRMESSINVSARARMEQYESMYENERMLTDELKAELKVKDSQLRKAIQDDPSVSDRGPNYAIVEHLESKTEIAQIRAQDLASEVGEYMEQNLQLKDEMREVPRFGSDLALNNEVKSLKHALEVERKEKRALGAQQYEKSCQFLGIVPSDVRVVTLENEVQAAHLEMSTLRAWNRQLDDAFNEEVNVAAQYAATSNQP
eukprot:s2439_g1.t1